ncbi:hypothetical protein [Protaetiibacter intestinalis]|uniref:Uncharacterized protein n=1 Tax=Protaetiibacter intestinalis TaxID=2419774 RepID=A0A387B4S4_9MICO|nr:hypothetical protein [Protaetiibacter intestinalis]AYF98654.1 hypothetical protein D7I47_10560 [Protaetiibacter intestinalis]
MSSPIPYDFSGLTRPMARPEVRARRRAILAGKSYFSALEIEHAAGLLVVGGICLLMLIPTAVVLAVSGIAAAHLVSNAGEAVGLVAVVVGAPLAAAAITYFSIRALVIPPRWRAWVRMHRFAEENGLEFVREESGVRYPIAARTPASWGPPRLYGAFRDHARGITLGDYVILPMTPRGLAEWLGVIEVRRAEVELDDAAVAALRRVLDEAASPWMSELVVREGDVLAVKRLPFRTRNSANLERAFRIAWALREQLPGRPGT